MPSIEMISSAIGLPLVEVQNSLAKTNGIFQLRYEVSIFFYNSDKCQKGQICICWMQQRVLS